MKRIYLDEVKATKRRKAKKGTEEEVIPIRQDAIQSYVPQIVQPVQMSDEAYIQMLHQQNLINQFGGAKNSYKSFANNMLLNRGIDINKDYTYDYRRYFEDNPRKAMSLANGNPNAHFTDKYKTTAHPTFSVESIYSNEKTPGGTWITLPNGTNVFYHSPYTAQHLDYTDDYLGNNARKGNVELSYWNGSYRFPTLEVVGKKSKIRTKGKYGTEEEQKKIDTFSVSPELLQIAQTSVPIATQDNTRIASNPIVTPINISKEDIIYLDEAEKLIKNRVRNGHIGDATPYGDRNKQDMLLDQAINSNQPLTIPQAKAIVNSRNVTVKGMEKEEPYYDDEVTEAMSYLPGIGDFMQLAEGVGALAEKNYGLAGLNLGLLFVPNLLEHIPGVPTLKRKIVRGINRTSRLLSSNREYRKAADLLQQIEKTQDVYLNQIIDKSEQIKSLKTQSIHIDKVLENMPQIYKFENPLTHQNYISFKEYYPSNLMGDVSLKQKGDNPTVALRKAKPIAKNVHNISKEINDYAVEIEHTIGNSGAIAGSTVLYRHGIISGTPNDIEFVTTKSKLTELKTKLNAKTNRNLMGTVGEQVSSTKAINGLADIEVIEESANGFAKGKTALEFYKVIDPTGYQTLLDKSISSKIDIYNLEIPISADDMLDIIQKNPEIMKQKTILDFLGSSKEKHHDRAKEFITSNNPQVATSLKDMRNTLFGKSAKSVEELYPNIRYDNIEANEEFLKYIDFPKELATDEQVMRNIVDYFDLTESATRSAENTGNLYINASKYSMRGGGGNYVIGSSRGGGANYGNNVIVLNNTITSHNTKIQTPADLAYYHKFSQIYGENFTDEVKDDLEKIFGIRVKNMKELSDYTSYNTKSNNINNIFTDIADMLGIRGMRIKDYNKGTYYGNLSVKTDMPFNRVYTTQRDSPLEVGGWNKKTNNFLTGEEHYYGSSEFDEIVNSKYFPAHLKTDGKFDINKWYKLIDDKIEELNKLKKEYKINENEVIFLRRKLNMLYRLKDAKSETIQKIIAVSLGLSSVGIFSSSLYFVEKENKRKAKFMENINKSNVDNNHLENRNDDSIDKHRKIYLDEL